MKTAVTAIVLTFLYAMPAQAQNIDIRPNGAGRATIAPPQNFAGHAVVSSLLPPNDSTRANLGLVTFLPGARTAWHTHPAGQLLIISAGQGWVQEEGQPRRAINAGDVVWIPAGVKHWHGATDTSPMSHYAMTYMVGDKNVDWMEQVTDEQYGAR